MSDKLRTNAEHAVAVEGAARKLLAALKDCRGVLAACAEDTAGTATESFFSSKVKFCDIVIADTEIAIAAK